MSLFNINSHVTHNNFLIKPIWLLLILLLNSPCQANDKTLLTNADAPHPGIGVALDSEGKPIAIPTKGSAMEYQPPQAYPSKKNKSKKTKSKKRKTTKGSKRKSTKTLSRKQTLASRIQVANDPGCRWLDKRMDKLEKSLSYAGNQTSYGFHRDELKIRHKEWLCMKCGAEGPKQRDHDACQYRR
ncbi:hypothetical protein [Shewanella violacea]|uniref:Secreted protein n=1 Tax=Shewanella violacea (strain JCM 10179 / CIP 106290 / LMG 19151 / DSS12) TaxID=637905 RepID=D4ZDI6_SHEVD|nr:hypothetical protein [Shewanella violacea]BAJ00108.1 conserved hypothetical protein [Shewanella violacea DSS12]